MENINVVASLKNRNVCFGKYTHTYKVVDILFSAAIPLLHTNRKILYGATRPNNAGVLWQLGFKLQIDC